MPEATPGIRESIERLLEDSNWREARFRLETLWSEHRTAATASFVLGCFERMRGAVPLQERRVAILRSFTVEPLIPMLRASALLAGGLDLNVRAGDFNTYVQEIFSEDSFLYSFDPHAVILALQLRDIAPELWTAYSELSAEAEDRAVEDVLTRVESWIHAFRARSTATLLVHNFEQPDMPRLGVLDGMTERSQRTAIQRLNDGLRRMTKAAPGVYPFDYDGLVARHGRRTWHDEQKWLTMRFPVAGNCAVHLAEEWTRYLAPLFGKSAKVVVTDLDNTLWRGVAGEDGPAGIQMDEQYPGALYRNVQRVLLDLHQRGILLAIASKNNEADALEILENHPDMILRPRHFAAIRCNWQNKAESLRSIAEELNVGLESLVFVDDNPAERDLVRRELPEVTVIELPSKPAGFARAIQDVPLFERLSLSQEDRVRGEHYAAQRQRQQLQTKTGSIEEFYRELDQKVEIRPVTRETVGRVAQLTQKTNQFNLTTRRYSEGEIAALMRAPGVSVYEVRVTDRFGDNGIVGAIITRQEEGVFAIDTFLLSCRVIGRTVETAILAFLSRESALAGTNLQGWFLPTKKNGPARDVYPQHGFQLVKEEDGKSLWSLDPSRAEIQCPEWISLILDAQTPVRDAVYSN